jgi:hypothetical protein
MKTIRFEELFRYDEKKVPRTWQSSDPVDLLYQTAAKQSEDFLIECSSIPLSFKNPPPTYISNNETHLWFDVSLFKKHDAKRLFLFPPLPFLFVFF